jgi:hypothetical protein
LVRTLEFEEGMYFNPIQESKSNPAEMVKIKRNRHKFTQTLNQSVSKKTILHTYPR